jgi:hypothetical protein
MHVPNRRGKTNMKVMKMGQSGAKRLERQWTQNLQEQAVTWKLAKSDGRYQTDQGVPVVRRHKRTLMKRPAA